MSILIHETPLILINQILIEGLTYEKRNYGLFSHPETEELNHAINKYRSKHINLDRNECVFFSFKRDYIKFGHNGDGVFVESNDLEQDKLFVFSNTTCGSIMWSLRNNGLNLKTYVEAYWKTMIPFQYYDQNFIEIEQRWKDICEDQGISDTEFGPEVLYFNNVPPKFISPWTTSDK